MRAILVILSFIVSAAMFGSALAWLAIFLGTPQWAP